MINPVEEYPLNIYPDSRGKVMKFVETSNPFFKNFSLREVYFSWVYPGAIKAWHLHSQMTMNYTVPVGNIKLVVYDPRPDSPDQFGLNEMYLGEASRHQVVRIPPGVWNGFMVVGNERALVVNATDTLYDPSEITRMHPETFSREIYAYDWYASFTG